MDKLFSVPAAIATMDEDHYLQLGTELTMDCRHAGDPSPNKKWFFNGRYKIAEYCFLQ
jgi:hypothetical protein